MNFTEIKKQLMTMELSTVQLKEIKAVADIRLGNFSAREGALKYLGEIPSDYADLFYRQIQSIFSNDLKISLPALAITRKQFPTNGKMVNKVAAEIYAVAVDWNTERTVKKTYVVSVFNLYARLVIAYLQECKVPTSLKTVLQHSDKFIGLVERAFPGYVEAGLISVVLKHKSTSA